MSEACVSSTTRSSGSVRLIDPLPAPPLRLLVVADRPDAAADLAAAFDPAWLAVEVADDGAAAEEFDADAVLINLAPGDAGALERAVETAGRLRDGPTPALVVCRDLAREERIALYRAGVAGFVDAAADSEELAARIASLLATKWSAARALRRLRDHSQHLDEQVRLAQRLQMDFLPRRMPVLGSVRFAARLEPAAWVAGDFYDVFRLDEQHVGFYVADAVGHGLPAALLTVFVKKSLQTKRIHGNDYELIPPEEALGLLNADLLSAELQEAPFVTMVYGIYNEATCECTYARAGHPRPLLLGPKGDLQQLDGEGPLLGIFPNATFSASRRRLEPGQRVLLYTDGAERVEPCRGASPDRLFEIIRTGSLLPVEALLDAILDAVRGATGGRRLADDVTLVALEVTTGEQSE
jgi:sigma-B regulation protein RsbU (phosphoserine phosphatase)